MDIKIYGKPTYTYSYIKDKVNDKLMKAGFDIHVSEFNNIEDFIKNNITSIPAVKVGKSMVQFQENVQIRDMIEEITELILKEKKSDFPLNIIIPTDYSNASINAISYAYKFAEHVSSKLHLIHAYHSNPANFNADFTQLLDKGWRLELMKDLVEGLNSEWYGLENLEFKSEGNVIEGLATDVVLNYVSSKQNRFIFLSNSGETGSIKKYFGSVSTSILSNTDVPMFVIPPDIEFRPLRKIVVAVGQTLSQTQIKTISTISNTFNSEIYLIHIDDAKNLDFRILERKFEPFINKNSIIHCARIISKNKEKALFDFYNSIDADLMVLNKSDKNKFLQIFSGSFSRQLAINAKFPLLIIPK